MIVQYRPKSLPKVTRKFKYIIIHDLTCMFGGVDQAKMDMKHSQVNAIRSYNWIVNGQSELNYHFVVEKVEKDYETMLTRPLNRLCEYTDIPAQYGASIHIGLLGKYSILKPSTRFYQQVAYRALASMMFIYKIPYGQVLMHSQISVDKDQHCPGEFFNYDI